MAICLGIDLGTTFSCTAWIDDDGHPQVVSNAEGDITTPSVVCFDGRQAWVGKKGDLRKQVQPADVIEFVKRDMGKPLKPRAGETAAEAAPYEKDGFCWGAAGISALILRKLKRDAIRHLKKLGRLDTAADEHSIEVDAVITVPAYFGGPERDATVLAGYAARLNVIGVINEPTAAALSYGLTSDRHARILVFDLGGGTFDVTILQMEGHSARVLTSRGNNTLGGKDWDAIIEGYIYEEFERRNRRRIPDDLGFEVQQLALKAKFDLTNEMSAKVSMALDEGDLDIELFREPSADFDELSIEDRSFYFEQRSSQLLRQCEVLCLDALARAQIPTVGGSMRSLRWDDIDEIVMTGGACRMPMIPKMLERIAARRVRRQVAGVDFDTAVAMGAALFGRNRSRVIDVLSHTFGVLVMRDGERVVEPMIKKDTRLPASTERYFPAGPRAFLEVYELGHEHATRPDESRSRGRVELENPAAVTEVKVTFAVDDGGVLKISATYPPDIQRLLELRLADSFTLEDANLLRDRVQTVKIH